MEHERLFKVHGNESMYKRDLADLFSLYFSLYLRCGLWHKSNTSWHVTDTNLVSNSS